MPMTKENAKIDKHSFPEFFGFRIYQSSEELEISNEMCGTELLAWVCVANICTVEITDNCATKYVS